MHAKFRNLERAILEILFKSKEVAHGVAIKKAMFDRVGDVSMGDLLAALKKMESKGMLKSSYGDTSQTRNGNRKRNYHLTVYGHSLVDAGTVESNKPGVKSNNI